MKILLDLQACQSSARHHGIGRYTLSLTKEMIHQAPQHEFWILLNANLSESIDDIKREFKDILADDRIISFHLPFPTAEEKAKPFNTRAAELIREYFIEALQPDIIHINSLFDGWKDNVAVSIGTLSNNVCTSITLYDLIPLVYESEYLPIKELKAFYNRKLDSLKKADLLLAISNYSKQEAQTYLAIDENKITNIKGSTDEIFQSQSTDTEEEKQAFYQKYTIDSHYILCAPSSFDPRKNLDNLLRAYAQLPESLKNKYKLILIGRSKPQISMQLENLAKQLGVNKQLVLTGYVPEEDLISFYRNCSLFVFPSNHEGFGLPPLEAMACGAVTISSSATSLAEVIDFPAAMFDPMDIAEMAKKMQQALTDSVLRQKIIEHAKQQVKKFTWQETAKLALAAIEKTAADTNKQPQAYNGFKQNQELYKQLINTIKKLIQQYQPEKQEIIALANAMARNEAILNQELRKGKLPPSIHWRIEGPFDSSYSLALLNRETALALHELGHQVILHSTEGTGDFKPNEQFLQKHPKLNQLYQASKQYQPTDADITSRNLYPPRVDDMGDSRINMLHHYAWEESGFPQNWVENFNQHLQGITCLSKHIEKILIDSGVTVPLTTSGCGVDHWEKIKPDPNYKLKDSNFHFLHVSSCFPRKGVDVLLKAYGKAFNSNDNVTLIIKTFPNPHNQVHEWLKEAQKHNSNYPKVLIIEEDLTQEQLKALYNQSDVLVAPSRAEGFGLPLAEAMLSNLAVITTGWGGQLDFCNDETAWLIDYKFSPAQTHFELFDSVWAEPSEKHLSLLMKKVWQLPKEERQRKSKRAKKQLLKNFKWKDIATNLVKSARAFSKNSYAESPKIGWVTSWNTKCGIATYSEHLINNIYEPVTVLASHTDNQIAQDRNNVHRCWNQGEDDKLKELSQTIEELQLDTIVIQFNYGFFNFEYLKAFLQEQIEKQRVIIVTLHATSNPKHASHKKIENLIESFAKCSRILVHTHNDLNKLKKLKLTKNVTLLPHGLVDWDKKVTPSNSTFTMASYGFFLPHKGLLELIEAVSLLVKRGIKIKLKMVNALYPAPESQVIIAQAKALIGSLNLSSHIELYTDFLSDQESLTLLSQADLIIFPYQETGESASGAVRYGLATQKPVAVTPLAIFDDIQQAVFKLKGTSVQDIADSIDELMINIKQNSQLIQNKQQDAKKWRKSHSYSHLGLRLTNILIALKKQKLLNAPIHLPTTKEAML